MEFRQQKIQQGDFDGDDARSEYIRKRIDHYNAGAPRQKERAYFGRRYYQKQLSQIYRNLIPPGKKVIEIGCGRGDLLASLSPSYGAGVDFSNNMIHAGKTAHSELKFILTDAHNLDIRETFDYIILSDVINDLWDVHEVLIKISKLSRPETRIILNFYSRLWELPLKFVRKIGLAEHSLPQNWLTVEDLENLLYLTGFEKIRSWQEILLPLPVPLLSGLANRFIVKIWPFNHLALTNFVIARLQPDITASPKNTSVSIVIPAKNEAGNIPDIFARTPDIGKKTELIFVEGHSSDNTYESIEKAISLYPDRCCKLFRQSGRGKGDAVRLGFKHAIGDVFMILDADLSMPPESLPMFFEMLCTGKGEFINGVRLVYPMEDRAMRFLNLVGNKFFSLAFSWLLGQPIKDTLCGTKVLWKKDYERIEENRSYFGDFDPFGDFDLIYGAVKQNLKIVDLPIRYRERKYGDTNISRWRHGLLLLKMLFFATVKIKFK